MIKFNTNHGGQSHVWCHFDCQKQIIYGKSTCKS